MSKNIKLSLVIPAYNEEKIIKESLEKILKFLSSKKYTWEVIVVDDGSIDRTSKIVKNFTRRGVLLKRFSKNKGKGAAIKAGVMRARGNFVIFMDSDLSVPLTNIDKFLQELEKGRDVVIGSRRAEGSKIVAHQPVLRENMGRFFTFLSNLATGAHISDFTCGFKGFARKAARKIWENSLINRWSYDSEILFLTKRYGYEIVEVPVSWRNREDTRVVLAIDVLTSFRDLLKIRVNDILGRYDK